MQQADHDRGRILPLLFYNMRIAVNNNRVEHT